MRELKKVENGKDREGEEVGIQEVRRFREVEMVRRR